MTPDDNLLIRELRRDEGVRHSPYHDTVDVLTVGVGHNLKAHPLPDGWTYPLTDAQVDLLLAQDLAAVFSGLDKRAAWWRDLSYPRQRVMANMAFNLGVDGLMTFKNTLQAIQERRFGFAASGMMASKWAKQVGDRASRLSKMMREG
jgi:lysozyme